VLAAAFIVPELAAIEVTAEDSVHFSVIFGCENQVVRTIKEIKPIDGNAVRCEANQCEAPAVFLFVGAGISGACWAYCEEHARRRAGERFVDEPQIVAAGASYY
jgi:hypothetical protein